MKELILEYVKKELVKGTDIDEKTPLISSSMIDSISTLQLVDFLEKNFSIEFLPHEVDRDNLDTVEKMISFLSSKKS